MKETLLDHRVQLEKCGEKNVSLLFSNLLERLRQDLHNYFGVESGKDDFNNQDKEWEMELVEFGQEILENWFAIFSEKKDSYSKANGLYEHIAMQKKNYQSHSRPTLHPLAGKTHVLSQLGKSILLRFSKSKALEYSSGENAVSLPDSNNPNVLDKSQVVSFALKKMQTVQLLVPPLTNVVQYPSQMHNFLRLLVLACVGLSVRCTSHRAINVFRWIPRLLRELHDTSNSLKHCSSWSSTEASPYPRSLRSSSLMSQSTLHHQSRVQSLHQNQLLFSKQDLLLSYELPVENKQNEGNSLRNSFFTKDEPLRESSPEKLNLCLSRETTKSTEDSAYLSSQQLYADTTPGGPENLKHPKHSTLTQWIPSPKNHKIDQDEHLLTYSATRKFPKNSHLVVPDVTRTKNIQCKKIAIKPKSFLVTTHPKLNSLKTTTMPNVATHTRADPSQEITTMSSHVLNRPKTCLAKFPKTPFTPPPSLPSWNPRTPFQTKRMLSPYRPVRPIVSNSQSRVFPQRPPDCYDGSVNWPPPWLTTCKVGRPGGVVGWRSSVPPQRTPSSLMKFFPSPCPNYPTSYPFRYPYAPSRGIHKDVLKSFPKSVTKSPFSPSICMGKSGLVPLNNLNKNEIRKQPNGTHAGQIPNYGNVLHPSLQRFPALEKKNVSNENKRKESLGYLVRKMKCTPQREHFCFSTAKNTGPVHSKLPPVSGCDIGKTMYNTLPSFIHQVPVSQVAAPNVLRDSLYHEIYCLAKSCSGVLRQTMSRWDLQVLKQRIKKMSRVDYSSHDSKVVRWLLLKNFINQFLKHVKGGATLLRYLLYLTEYGCWTVPFFRHPIKLLPTTRSSTLDTMKYSYILWYSVFNAGLLHARKNQYGRVHHTSLQDDNIQAFQKMQDRIHTEALNVLETLLQRKLVSLKH